MQFTNEVLSYRIGSRSFETLEDAKASMSNEVANWIPVFYDKCIYCGDSLVGIDANGKQICEIKFYQDNRFCIAPLHNDVCGYKRS
jgi:hypothetical protein